MAFQSSGKLEQDIKDIAIKQMGGEKVYRSLDPTGKNKIDSYAADLTGAIKAFLERQEFNITDMEAVGMIPVDAIQVAGASINVPPGAPAVFTPTPAKPGTLGYLSNTLPIPIKVQLSQTSNKVGLPEVLQNVKKTIIKLLNSRD